MKLPQGPHKKDHPVPRGRRLPSGLPHSNPVARRPSAKTLPKGLRFLRAVPTTECPKVMGLMSIHDPNALWHYAGYTYCPCCGKEGQNEGTVVNHLRTTHYRLGLVFWLPNSDVRCTSLAWVPKLSMVLCLFWIGSVQLTHLPNQEFIQGSEGGAIQLGPLSYERPGDSMKKVLLASPPNPSFILQPHQQDSYFHSSCDLNCSRKT